MRATLISVVVAAAVAVSPVSAATPGEFYAGRSVQLIVGFSAGGGYDLYARVLARHMGRHIPGNPSVVPQNMPGAGSVKAANFFTASRRKTAPCSASSIAAYRWSACSAAPKASNSMR